MCIQPSSTRHARGPRRGSHTGEEQHARAGSPSKPAGRAMQRRAAHAVPQTGAHHPAGCSTASGRSAGCRGCAGAAALRPGRAQAAALQGEGGRASRAGQGCASTALHCALAAQRRCTSAACTNPEAPSCKQPQCGAPSICPVAGCLTTAQSRRPAPLSSARQPPSRRLPMPAQLQPQPCV